MVRNRHTNLPLTSLTKRARRLQRSQNHTSDSLNSNSATDKWSNSIHNLCIIKLIIKILLCYYLHIHPSLYEFCIPTVASI